MSAGRFGKYREIVLAVAFFLLFDLGVLVLNFYTSYSISEDAVAINLTGRQRMLSQRISKAVLALEQDVNGDISPQASQNELASAMQLFDQTLAAFAAGGVVKGGDGRPVRLEAVTDAQGRALLAEAQATWQPLHQQLKPLIKGEVDLVQVIAASRLARTQSLKLLEQMNRLTTHMEAVADQKAARLRMVQTGGIVLALLNFVFILFKFIRRMQASDREAERAREETGEILGTVREGLLLLDKDFHVGSQFSSALPGILGCEVKAGDNFLAILQARVTSANYEAALSYMKLLFGKRVKEALIAELNPLTEVLVQDGGEVRYLSLQFNRAWIDGEISHLLVTIQDVSEQVALRQAIAEAKQQARQEVEVLLDMLRIHPDTLAGFLENTREILQNANDSLRELDGDATAYRRLVGNLFRRIHSLKGDAGTLGLTLFERLAHDFEDQLVLLREKSELTGDDCLALLPHLDACFERMKQVQQLLGRIQKITPAQDDGLDVLDEQLHTLARRIARDQGKSIELEADLAVLHSLPDSMRKAVQDILIQLVRNAVVHGIEVPEERARLGKSPTGKLKLDLLPTDSGEYELTVHDDGGGINPAEIRKSLIKTGRYSMAMLAEFSDQQVVMKIFDPGISTAKAVTRDAGRGVGMALVKQQVSALGGHLRLASRPGNFTAFTVRFAV